MSIEVMRYVRKPVWVDAFQVTEENFFKAAIRVGGQVRHKSRPFDVLDEAKNLDPVNHYIYVPVNRAVRPRQTQAFVGDWILYSDTGGYKVYSNRAFERQFRLTSGLDSGLDGD